MGGLFLFEHSNALREHVDLYKKIKESWISDSYGVHRCDTRNGYQKIGSEESFFPEEQVKKTLGLLDRFVT